VGADLQHRVRLHQSLGYLTRQLFLCGVSEELLKRAQDMIHEDQDYLKDFNAAVNQPQKGRQSSRLNILVSGIAIHYPAHGFSGAIPKPAAREKLHDDLRGLLRIGLNENVACRKTFFRQKHAELPFFVLK